MEYKMVILEGGLNGDSWLRGTQFCRFLIVSSLFFVVTITFVLFLFYVLHQSCPCLILTLLEDKLKHERKAVVLKISICFSAFIKQDHSLLFFIKSASVSRSIF